MANPVIQIKRSTTAEVSPGLASGELAHLEKAGFKKLYIGTSGSDEVIGGLHYTDILDTVTQATVLGRKTASTGEVEELAAADLNTILGLSGSNTGDQLVYKTFTVIDTDSGYSWTETGSTVAGTTTDTVEFVSGTGVNVDVDATNDAIRITNSSPNVSTALSTGNVTATTYGITSDSGTDDVVLVEATTAFAGLLGSDKWDQIVANNAKNTNVSTTLTAGTVTATTYGITSDGGADDIVLPEADTTNAGLLGSDKWDQIVANNAKVTNATHTGQADGATALALNVTAITAQPASGALSGTDTFMVNDGGVLSETTFAQLDTYLGTSLGAGTVLSVASGNGMNFTEITDSGTVTLGTPSALTASTTDALTANSHTHSVTGFILSTYLDTAVDLGGGSSSNTKVATQLAVKTYVDTAVTSALTYKGAYNASTNSPDLETPAADAVSVGDMYTVTVAGDFFNSANPLEVGDVLIAEIDDPTVVTDWTLVQRNIDNATDAVYGITRLSDTADVAANTVTQPNDVVTIDGLATYWVGSTNVTTVGTITTGTWDCGTFV
jgi:hypothetical protein